MTHGGHEAVIKHASQKADRLVLLVGSSELARDPKNPFTFEERKSVLEAMSQRIVSEEWSKGRSVKVDILPIMIILTITRNG
ncbi:putative minor tail protein [Salmonella phage 40]|nr:putative minor tail protein [Salmonella phage 40]